MRKLIRKFIKNEDGAIAVETAVVTPLLIFILLPALDLGMQVHATQKMNKATDSGIEYIVNGGRDETTLRNIVQASFGQTIAGSDLAVQAYCGCLVEAPQNSSGGNNGDDDDDDDDENTQSPSNPYASYYVKSTTTLAEDMCPSTCTGGKAPSELVELSLSHEVTGAWKAKTLNTSLQTRIK